MVAEHCFSDFHIFRRSRNMKKPEAKGPNPEHNGGSRYPRALDARTTCFLGGFCYPSRPRILDGYNSTLQSHTLSWLLLPATTRPSASLSVAATLSLSQRSDSKSSCDVRGASPDRPESLHDRWRPRLPHPLGRRTRPPIGRQLRGVRRPDTPTQFQARGSRVLGT
ncbi:hypothetical protein DAEQUDRAFT_384894 [Daedalea quercina L-15889]|uniref:Uncharacterized protein n=1 Tax=Daedalea quercina L-15889 TaxID=1314783 RepID=A0A165P1N9_9APHY|nr:hypothetical protein DAEQUDRAFT_384894 [Daedalea quercina L-15889]